MNAHGLRFHPLPDEVFADLQTRSVFELGKWDQQYFDHPSLADFALELQPEVYHQLAAWSEAMAGESFRAEQEILSRPALLNRLSLPGKIKRALRLQGPDRQPAVRLCRFDFHPTDDGWKISEVNSDVPGGLLESDGLARLLADRFANHDLLPSTTGAYLDALLSEGASPDPVGLVHATSYTDDRQVMLYLQRELEARGQRAILLSPDNLRWERDAVSAQTEWYAGAISKLVRFYPAEWMSNLPASCRWRESLGTGSRWMSNPLHALISQSKAFPLVWNELREPMAIWRRMLPETRVFRQDMILRRKEWLFKPALGRVGEGIFLSGVSSRKSSLASLLNACLYPRDWIAQRPFRAINWEVKGVPRWPCLGLYTVNEKAAGIYARTARKPLVDGSAQDTSVFLGSNRSLANQMTYDTAGTV